eukprot:GHVL01017286.1.p2 GENE.GHVL01017286.1~~GHVL01017286.1.p2  ORF type:complete len:245 (-),score=59.14 GHVL01017286.1:995-1729(-)
MMGKLGTFKNGVMSPISAVSKQLENIRLNSKVTSVTSCNDFKVTVETDQGVEEYNAKSVAITTPAYIASKIMNMDILEEIVYTNVGIVVTSHKIDDFLRGFGHLIPSLSQKNTLGSIWGSSMFPQRAPPGYQMISTFIGGSRKDIQNVTDDKIINLVSDDLKKIFFMYNMTVTSILSIRRWKIPQPTIGHTERLQKLKNSKKGVFFGGNYVYGVAIGDCINGARNQSSDIIEYLETVKVETDEV